MSPSDRTHRRRPATGTTSPAITVTTAARPPTVVNESSRAAVAHARARSISAASDRKLRSDRKPSNNEIPAHVRRRAVRPVPAIPALAVRTRLNGEGALSGDEHPGHAAERRTLWRRAALVLRRTDRRRIGVGTNPAAAD